MVRAVKGRPVPAPSTAAAFASRAAGEASRKQEPPLPSSSGAVGLRARPAVQSPADLSPGSPDVTGGRGAVLGLAARPLDRVGCMDATRQLGRFEWASERPEGRASPL